MKNLTLTLVLLLLFGITNIHHSSHIMKHKKLNYVFDLAAVPAIKISVSPKEWNKLLSDFDQNPKSEIYVKASFEFEKNGKKDTLRNVGLRLRGNIFSKARPEMMSKKHNSQDARWHASHFRIKFDKYDKKQSFHSLDALNLKAFNGDPAMVREIYSLDLFQRFGVHTAQRTSYVRLYIHVTGDKQPAYFGIYRMLEPIDQNFINKRFPKNEENGFLWKCLYPADLREKEALNKMGLEDPNGGKSYAYDLKTRKNELKTAKKKFYQFIHDLNKLEGPEFEKWAEEHIDIELLLRAQAVNVLLGMWDDYWINNNNYYLYFDDKDVCRFIPYDYDNSLGTSSMRNAGTADVFTWGPLDNSRPLMAKIMAVPEYKQQYGNYIAQLISKTNELFHITHSTNRIKKWHTMISPYLENDTRQHTMIMDKPAQWGEASYYRLYTGNHYGGPLEANYFLTRTFHAQVNLGMKKALPQADIDVTLSGTDFHKEKKYFYVFRDKQTVNLELKSKYKLTKVILKGAADRTILNPDNKIPINLDFTDPQQVVPLGPGWVPRIFLDVIAIDDNNQGIQGRIAIFKFDNSYKSPEIQEDTVIFRHKYAGNDPIELHGNFNGWGDQKMLMTKVSDDMWEYRIKLKDIKVEPSKGDPDNKVRYGFMIMKEKPTWSADKANINSRRGSAFFYLP